MPSLASQALLPAAIAAGLILFLANFLGGNPGISGWDANHYFSHAAAIASGDGLVLDGAYEAILARGGDPAAFGLGRRTPTGQAINHYPHGHGLLQAPAVVATSAIARLLGARDPAHGLPGQLAFCLSAIALAALGVWLMRDWIARTLDDEAAAAGLLALLAASPLAYYWFILPALSHTSTLLVAGLATVLVLRIVTRGEASTAREWLLLGFVLGWGVTVRLHDVGLAGYALAVFVVEARARHGGARLARLSAAGIVGAAVALLPQVLHGQWREGAFLPRSANDYSHFDFTDMHLLEVLFSPRHGLFLWHPVLLAGAIGFVMWLRRERAAPARALGLAWTVHFLAIWIVGAGYSIWWFGDSFGSRPFLSVLPLFWVGLAELWRRAASTTRGRWMFLGAVGTLGAWNGLLMVAFHLGWISRSGPLDFAQLAAAVGLR